MRPAGKLDAYVLGFVLAAEQDPAQMKVPHVRDIVCAALIVDAVDRLAAALRADTALRRADARHSRKARKRNVS